MGSNQSTTAASGAERVLMERLRALELEKKQAIINEDGFVEVDHSFEGDGAATLNEKTLGALRRSPTSLSVEQLEGWQSRVLADPKNRFVLVNMQCSKALSVC